MSSADDMIKVLKSNKELLDKYKPFKFGTTLGKKKLLFSKYKMRKLTKEQKRTINLKISKQNFKIIRNYIISISLALIMFYLLSLLFIKIFF